MGLALEINVEYKIDYSLYTTEEIIDIIEFLNTLEMPQDNNDETLLEKYTRFKNIINNQAEEKKIDQAFYKQTGISIYKTIQKLKSTM